MSAIKHLKNLVVTFTGKLFTSSKKDNGRQTEIRQADENTAEQTREGLVSVIGRKKDYEASQQLSDFTIF